MTMIGANIAIIQDNKILLTKREDFEVWCLPGGQSEAGESLAQTAIREAYEETGYRVAITRLVGVYSRLGGGIDIHGALFVGEIIGGEMKPQAEEVIDIGFFNLNNLPQPIFWWHIPQIEDAMKGVGGGAAGCSHFYPAETVTSRKALYEMRDNSGLSRSEFYQYYFESHTDNKFVRDIDKK
ncbi:MAG: NUDIX domain-containing protein [Anaerolineae bacterium]|nr:NUDIX domain-containing protein [Anaerolineae bacterium]